MLSTVGVGVQGLARFGYSILIARFVGTDEASLVERLPGARLVAVEAANVNPKVTTPADLPLVEALLGAHADPEEVREWL